MATTEVTFTLDAETVHRIEEAAERLAKPKSQIVRVLYEWLRGPRTSEQLALQEALFPSQSAIPFDREEAIVSADLYRAVSRARSREVDLAIAARALVRGARLWTLNHADFQDVPGIRLYGPR
jgi:predicted nucleic acid-binding protein